MIRTLTGAVVAALARDEAALGRLSEALEADEPYRRVLAALGLALLGPAAAGLRDRVASRLVVERDPRAFRALALAAFTVGARVDPARLADRFEDRQVGPEALRLAAEGIEGAASRTRRRLRRAMRRALRAPEARLRAGAALALARAGDRGAWRALEARLDDPQRAVRLAVAQALASLSVEASLDAVAARERVEPDPAVRWALRAVATATDGRDPPAWLRGGEVLYARVVTAEGLPEREDGMDVDVILPDGRWLLVPTLPGGDVLVPDAPGGQAEVQVHP